MCKHCKALEAALEGEAQNDPASLSALHQLIDAADNARRVIATRIQIRRARVNLLLQQTGPMRTHHAELTGLMEATGRAPRGVAV